MSNIHHPNDKFFKAAFSYQNIVKKFIELCLPKNLVTLFNLENLKLESTSYIRNDLKEFFSDVVYSCSLNGKLTTFVLLFEHKTVIGRDIYIQLNTYILEILKQIYKEHNRFDIVIPIVVYQGTEKYVKLPFSYFFETAEPELLRFIPNFDFELVGLQKIGDNDILSFDDEDALKAVLLAMKNAHRKTFVRKYFSHFFKFSLNKPFWGDFSEQMLLYLYHVSGLKGKEIASLIKSQNNEQLIMRGKSAAQEFYDEGKMAEKIELVKASWEEGLLASLTARITKLSISKVEKLYKQFEAEAKITSN